MKSLELPEIRRRIFQPKVLCHFVFDKAIKFVEDKPRYLISLETKKENEMHLLQMRENH